MLVCKYLDTVLINHMVYNYSNYQVNYKSIKFKIQKKIQNIITADTEISHKANNPALYHMYILVYVTGYVIHIATIYVA